MRRSNIIIFVVITGFTLVMGTFLYTATPDRSPFTVYLPIYLLTAVLLAIPAGIFLSLRRYALILLAGLLVVSAVPLLGGGALDSLACSTRGRTPVRDLDAQLPAAQVTFCGEVVQCQVATNIALDGSEIEVCVMRDLQNSTQIAFFNYILPDRAQATSGEIGAAEALALRDTEAGTVVVREGRWEQVLDVACAVPGVCALQPIPIGEVYGSPAVYDVVRQ